MPMSRVEARRLVRRLVSDEGFAVRLAALEDDDELDRLIHAQGFDCTWREVLVTDWLPLAGARQRHPREAG